MNGAAGDADRNTNPISNRVTTRIGASHHFLLSRKKSMNSRTMPGSVDPDRLSNSFASFRVRVHFIRVRVDFLIGMRWFGLVHVWVLASGLAASTHQYV